MAFTLSGNKRLALPGLLLLLFLIVCIVVNLKLLNPPDVIPASESNNQFSAERAAKYISVIAAEPHSSGTPAHAKVRDYIFNFCKEQGLEVQIQEVTGVQLYTNRARAGLAQNIIARLPGSASSKSILIMSHYDSQPNTPGASDDGAGVAAAMEAMRMLKNEPQLKNDVIFLFTDLEEIGLFGAQGFVNEYEDINKIGLLLNFEARGNAGVSITFEVTKNNRWLMENYVQAVGSSYANSIAYEIYKRMPNGSDFTEFKNTDIEGFNTAFIDGFTYYHSMADRLENMDLGSLQNQGDILIRSLRHFGNITLDTQHPQEDAIYFNPIGNWLWIYPISWDIPFMVLSILLFVCIVILGVKRGRVRISKTLLGIALYVGVIVTSMLLVWLLEAGVLKLYPAYSSFDGSNSYNAMYYLISITGAVLLCFAMWYYAVAKNISFESFMMGGLFVLLIIMVFINVFFPTGTYMLYYPLIVALFVYLILYLFDIRVTDKPLTYSLFQIIFLLPALCMYVPFVYLMFVTFSHSIPLVSVAIMMLCIPLLIPSFRIIQSINDGLTFSLASSLILGGFILAHINSEYTKREPLQTYLTYLLDKDTNIASWVSEQEYPDDWTKQFVNTDSTEHFEWYKGYEFNMWRGNAPAMAVDVGEVKIISDTVINNSRFLKLTLTGDTTTITLDVTLPPKTYFKNVSNKSLPDSVKRLSFWAIPSRGIEVELQAPIDTPISMSIIERKMGLPKSAIKKELPENMIYGQGTFCNTTQIRRSVVLNDTIANPSVLPIPIAKKPKK